MTSFAIATPGPSLSLAGLRRASPLLWWLSLGFLAAFIACAALTTLDPRLLNGISVWIKPAKFFLSLAVHMLTLCFGLTLLPEKARGSRTSTAVTATMASMAVLEMIYITFRAARGEASHFNSSSELAALLYSLMGAGAALMMVVTFVLGLQILRHGRPALITSATGWGLIGAAILTLGIGFTLGGMGSHWIGGDQTDATGLPIFGWSTTGGDLRPAHFAGLHLMQVLPLAALTRSPSIVWMSGLVMVLVTIAAYVLALNGLPLIRL